MTTPKLTRVPCHRTWSLTPQENARRAAVISTPDLGVLAVAAAGVCVPFAAWWRRYLHSVSAADLVQVPLSLLFCELSIVCVNAVQLHVIGADVLVRRGIDRESSR
jgi:hypothetical protein